MPTLEEYVLSFADFDGWELDYMRPISRGVAQEFLLLFTAGFVPDPDDATAPVSFLALLYPRAPQSELPSVHLPVVNAVRYA